jgi:very-short-patch-repair endonuclease
MTPTEKILWQELRANKLGVHFRRHTCPGGRCRGQVIAGFIVDFYCHEAALVVEVDGMSMTCNRKKTPDAIRF